MHSFLCLPGNNGSKTVTNQTKASICASLTVLSWSTVSSAFKIALERLSPMQLISLSMGVAALFLFGTLLFRQEFSHLLSLTKKEKIHSLMLGVLLYLYYAALFLGYERLPAQIAQSINYTWAILLTILSWVVLKQKASMREFFCLLFAYTGVLLISFGAKKHFGSLDPFGLFCIILSTLLYAIYWILNAKSTIHEIPSLLLSFLCAHLLSLTTVFLQGETLFLPLPSLLGGIYVGLFELAIPFFLWATALRMSTSVARIAYLPFLVPFLALFWISFLLHEPVATTTILGLAIIVLASFLQKKKTL